jgi:hypothetical protein
MSQGVQVPQDFTHTISSGGYVRGPMFHIKTSEQLEAEANLECAKQQLARRLRKLESRWRIKGR